MSPRQTRRRFRLGVLASAVAAGLGSSAPSWAAGYTWQAGANGDWSNPANWVGSVAPLSAADTGIIFNTSGTLSYTSNNDLGNPFRVQVLSLSDRSTGVQRLTGSAFELGTTDPFAGVHVSRGAWQIANEFVLDQDIYFFLSQGTNVVTLNGAFSGPGRALIYGGTGPTAVINSSGSTHGGTQIVGGVVALGPAGTLGSHGVLVSGTSQTARLVIPSAANIASGPGSVTVARANFVEFGSMRNNEIGLLSGDSEGVVAIRADTAMPSAISFENAPAVRLGISSAAGGGVVRLTSAITPAGNTYRFGGLAQPSSGPPDLFTNVLSALDVGSLLSDGADGAARQVNIGDNGVSLGGKVRLSNLSNTYSGGTVIERSTGGNGAVFLSFDYTPEAGQTPLGTGPVTVNGGLLLEGEHGALGALPNAITFRPGSQLVLNNVLRVGTSPSVSADLDRWPDARPIALNGTELELTTEGTSAAFTEKVGAVSYAAGSRVSLTNVMRNAVTLHADSLTRVGQGTLAVNATFADTWTLRVSDASGLVDPVTGMVHPSVVTDDGPAAYFGYHAQFLRPDASGYLKPYPFGTLDPASDHEVAAAGGSLAADETVWAVHAYDLNLNGRSMTVRSGGFVLAGGTVQNGTLRFENGGRGVEALLYARRGEAAVSANIVGGGLTIFGPGFLTLSGSNALGGPLALNEGDLILGSPGALAGVTGARLELGTSVTLNANSVTVTTLDGAGLIQSGTASGTATLTVGGPADSEFSGRLVDTPYRNRVVALTKVGTGTFTLSGVNTSGGVDTSTGYANPAGGYDGLTTVAGGTLVLAERFTRYGGYHTAAGASLVFQTDHAVRGIDGTGDTIIAPGVSVVATHFRQRGLALGAGARAVVRPGGGAAGVCILGQLTLGAGATLDVGDSALVLDYDGPSPLGATAAAVRSAYAGGTWTGPGIGTSVGGAGGAIGYGEAARLLGLSGGGTATWMGEDVDATSILVRYTVAGDATLDGVVNFDDLLSLAKSYNATGPAAGWAEGDFDYSGAVNFDDLLVLAKNYNKAVAAPAVPGATAEFNADVAAAFAAVPEPATGGLILAAAVMAMGARRRRRI